jgi:hypothetical protein
LLRIEFRVLHFHFSLFVLPPCAFLARGGSFSRKGHFGAILAAYRLWMGNDTTRPFHGPKIEETEKLTENRKIFTKTFGN